MEANSTHTVSTRDIIHAGFQEIGRAKERLNALGEQTGGRVDPPALLARLAHSIDPDTALANLADIIQVMPGEPLTSILDDGPALQRLIDVLGASNALGVLMRTRPDLVAAATADPARTVMVTAAERRTQLLDAVGADSTGTAGSDGPAQESSLPLAQAASVLRRAYREQLAAIMAQDVVADDPIDIQPTVSRELSALTDATLEAALAIARHEVQGSSMVRFAIIGMGKLGAGELNYVSDVDLIYVVEPAQDDVDNTVLTRVGTKMATMMQRVCQSVIAGVAEPALWQIDGALRPEGKDGPLVRRLESHRAYYEQWAQNWEFQALLKARAVAGDAALGQEYMDMASSFVWTAASRENFVNDCQRMRERVENLIPANLKDREIKLGLGGLRDVEFTVQMLQLVHGRTDPALRTRSTLNALQALSEGGYVSRVQARQLSWDYRF